MSYDDDSGRGARIQESLGDYNTIPERIAEFREKHPEGSLQPADLGEPIKIITIGDRTFLQYIALAFRTWDDTRPGVGIAWEEFPGRTPYTRNSEAMNAETSAWGRAIVAALAADAKKGIATQQEIQNRRAEQQMRVLPNLDMLDEAIGMLMVASNRAQLIQAWNFAGTHHLFDVEIPGEGVKYREFWKQQREIVDGLGQNTEQPAPVAPAEAEKPQSVVDRENDPDVQPDPEPGNFAEEKPLTEKERREMNRLAAQAARDAKALEPDLGHGDH